MEAQDSDHYNYDDETEGSTSLNWSSQSRSKNSKGSCMPRFQSFCRKVRTTQRLVEKFPGLLLDVARYPRPGIAPNFLHTSSTSTLSPIGFYGKASEVGLACLVFRLGLLAALRSRHNACATGALLTGSGLPGEYHGIQLVDGTGRAFPAEWEHHAAELVYAESTDRALIILQGIVDEFNISPTVAACNVVVACDIRERSGAAGPDNRDRDKTLLKHFSAGVDTLGGQVDDVSQRTLPQLQDLVRLRNAGERFEEVVYYRRLINNFNKLANKREENILDSRIKFMVDGGNSVAATKLAHVHSEISQYFDLRMVNMGLPIINDCGSEYVLSQRRLPRGIVLEELDPDTVCASFNRDGTAVVFYYMNRDDELVVIGGDRIGALTADFIREKMKCLVGARNERQVEQELRLCILQTLSANGGSTSFFQQHVNGVTIKCPPALTNAYALEADYDITVFFDRSGYGTVFFNTNAMNAISKMDRELSYYNKARGKAASPLLSCVVEDLVATSQLFSNTGSDAIATFLFVTGVLYTRRWALESLMDLYRENPCLEVELKVRDNAALQFNRQYHIIGGMQRQLDQLVRPYHLQNPNSKVVVEKPITRDTLLVMVEARSEAECRDLAEEAAVIIFNAMAAMDPGSDLDRTTRVVYTGGDVRMREPAPSSRAGRR